MLQKHRSPQTKPFQIALALAIAILGFLSLSPAQAQSPCEAALQSAQDVINLGASSAVSVEQGVSEWDSEILKLQVNQTGLLALDVESGPEADGSLQTLGASGLRLVNGAPLRPEHPFLTLVAPGVVYCLRVVPRPGAAGLLQVRMELLDLCRLGPSPDDHGDSFACATAVQPGDQASGSITPGDRDVFAFSLETGGTVEIQSDGGTDVAGRLYDETGTLLDSDDDSGPGLGFLISRTLPAGRYFVRVESSHGAAGAYTLSLDQAP
jgi:hypothetical protein